MSGSAAPDGGAYQLVLVAHLIAVIVGFGGLILARTRIRRMAPKNDVGQSSDLAASDLAAADVAVGALEATERWVEWFVYAVPVLGILLVTLSEDRWHFSQTWLGLSFAAYLGAMAIHQGLLRPNARAMAALRAATDRSELVQRARKAKVLGAAFDALLVATVALMVIKPGA